MTCGRSSGSAVLALLVLACSDTHPPKPEQATSVPADGGAGAREAPVEPRDAGARPAQDGGASGASADSGKSDVDAARPPQPGAADDDAGATRACAQAQCDPEEASCVLTAGSAQCRCADGYRDVSGNGQRCEEIDECAFGTARCASNASCRNTPNGYVCRCDPGYHGDGLTTCEPNASCTIEASEPCGEFANCVTVGASGTCQCTSGHEGDGRHCVSVDECARALDDCHGLATCQDSPNGYQCQCPAGLLGDGHGGLGCFYPQSRLTMPVIPQPGSRPCPDFAQGTLRLSEPLSITLFLGTEAAQPSAPLLFYWHGTGSSSAETQSIAGPLTRKVIEAGGIVAAIETTSGTGGDCSGTQTFARDDFEVADWIAACAVRDYHIDPRRIYTTGCSSGGLQAACMASARSSYIAAVVTNSGGMYAAEPLQAAHVAPTMTMFSNSQTLLIDFALLSRNLARLVRTRGGFAVSCNHDGGHCQAPEPLQLAAWQFMLDHPFGSTDEPYSQALPANFPAYCRADR